MQKITIELIGEVNIYFGLGIQIITALILGGMIGFDRERKMKSAGIKTNVMICLGATLYTAIAHLNLWGFTGPADPNRMAAQIVSGIGFLGAGAIIQGRGNVVGLTTAATIWVVAAIGVTIGSGYPLIATLFTVSILIVLKLLGPLYTLLESEKNYKHYHFEILSKGKVKNSAKSIILGEINNINELFEEVLNKEEDERLLNVYITVHPKRVKAINNELKQLIKVERVNYYLTDYTGKDEES